MNAAYKNCLGEVLSEKRRIADINKRKLSMMTGISRLTIRKIENGETNPSVDVLLKMTQGIGVSLAEVFMECELRLQKRHVSGPSDPYVLFDSE